MSRQERVKRVRRWTALTVVAVGVLWRPAPHLSAQARPQPVKSVRLYVFDLGMFTYLGLSHYHGDHAANANAFAASTWIVQEPERAAMFSDPPIRMATLTMSR